MIPIVSRVDTHERPRPGRRAVARRTVGVAIGLLLVIAVDAADQSRWSRPSVVDDVGFPVPIPDGGRLLAGEIDSQVGRSIAVIDLDATTPADWTDVVIVSRRRSLPGVVLGRATGPVPIPDSTAGIDEWRSWAAGTAIRADPHPDLREARSALARFRDQVVARSSGKSPSPLSGDREGDAVLVRIDLPGPAQVAAVGDR